MQVLFAKIYNIAQNQAIFLKTYTRERAENEKLRKPIEKQVKILQKMQARTRNTPVLPIYCHALEVSTQSRRPVRKSLSLPQARK
jgi:hypothetical protein